MDYPRIGRGRARGGRLIDMSQFSIGRGELVHSVTNELQPVAGRGAPSATEMQPVGVGRGKLIPSTNDMVLVAGRGKLVPSTNEIQHVAGRGKLAPSNNEIQPMAGRRPPVLLNNEVVQPGAGRGGVLMSSNNVRLAAGRGIGIPSASPQRPVTIGGNRLVATPAMPGPSVGQGTSQEKKPHNSAEEAKIALEKDLIAFKRTGCGCFFRISLNYFSHSNDIEFYVDTVLDSVLKSPVMVEKFSMSLKLLTLLKHVGDEIKRCTFTKLQQMFQNTVKFMEERTRLSEREKDNLTNFCDLIGQLFFRLRPRLDDPDRYNVLAPPTMYCMTFLLRVCGVRQLQALAKMIVLNYNALRPQFESRMEHLCVEAHKALLDDSRIEEERLWLMAIIHLLTVRDSMPQSLEQFYAERLSGWVQFKGALKSPVQMVADLPNDITLSEVDKFNVSPDEYNLHKCAEL